MNTLEMVVPQGVNPALHDEQLRAVLPAIVGTTFIGNDVVAHFNYDPVSGADASTFNTVCAAHDPKQQTAAQQQSAVVVTDTLALLAKVKQEAAYFAAVPAADLTNGAALARLCADFSLLLLAVSVRLS